MQEHMYERWFIQQPEVITVISLFLLGYYEDVNEMAFSKTAET